MFNEDGESNTKKITKYLFRGFLIIFGIIVLFNSFGTVGAGERGVRTRFGAVQVGVVGEGLYLKIPLVDRVQKMDVKIQKDQTDATAASSDLQDVTATVAVNYHLVPSEVASIYQNIGISYRKNTTVADRLISPAIQEAVKASTAKFTAEQLITKREDVRNDIKGLLINKLSSRGIIVDELNIINFNFSTSFNQAIEAKVTAEQNALAAKNKLAQVQFEAQQAVAKAQGDADAIRIKAQALQDNPGILQLNAIDKWNGVLPQVTGGAVPFVNILK
jgi:regulator of protease activity HflC (stomatin/prohibitin superfamily)